MSKALTIEINDEDDGVRLDRWFKRHYPALPFGQVSKIIRTGQVRLDGSRAKVSTRLESGQVLRLPPNLQDTQNAPPAVAKLSDADEEFVQSLVIRKDDHIIALNKPTGLAVQGGSKTHRHLDGLLDGLRFGADMRPKLVHRLDRDTSGVLILARTAKSAGFLAKAFKERTTRKIYWALCAGVPRPAKGLIDLPLLKEKGRSGRDYKERTVPAAPGDPNGRPAQTYYAEIDRAAQRAAWLALMPVTGRTHQLRVHCAAIGHPIIGDYKYGGDQAREPIIPEQEPQLHLHARSLDIPHPAGRRLSVVADLPAHMAQTWKTLEFSQNDDGAPFDDLAF